jgi:glycerol uptake operon antiterminator
MFDFSCDPIIAAVRDDVGFEAALVAAPSLIFLLKSSILDIGDRISRAHENGKKLFVHIDLADGIGKDEVGISYLAKLGVDGIISTRTSIIKAAKEAGLISVQRFFMIDSRSVDTAAESLIQSRADMAELMPGVSCKAIKQMKRRTRVPLIAGGLIDEKSEIIAALSAGAAAISTGNVVLWDQ